MADGSQEEKPWWKRPRVIWTLIVIGALAIFAAIYFGETRPPGG